MSSRTAVVAVGGNALSPSGERATIYDQFRYAREALVPIVDLALDGWNVCVVHGNGPQVGDELVRNEAARREVASLPLGVLVASTAGWIGYMVQQSIQNALKRGGSKRDVVSVVTQVIVEQNDPALLEPTKFIGHALTPERAAELTAAGVTVKVDDRGNHRRVVGSPTPIAINELAVIRSLVESGTIVIACGGGGIPVYRDPRLGLEGVDAVVDKDLAAAVLARDLGAEMLLILTDVDAVYANFGSADQKAIGELTVEEAENMDSAGAFGEGSMAPKIRATVDYVRRTGGLAIITELSRGRDAVAGKAGTRVVP